MIAKFHAAHVAANVKINFQAPPKLHLGKARQFIIQAVDSTPIKVFALAIILLDAPIWMHLNWFILLRVLKEGIFWATLRKKVNFYMNVVQALQSNLRFVRALTFAGATNFRRQFWLQFVVMANFFQFSHQQLFNMGTFACLRLKPLQILTLFLVNIALQLCSLVTVMLLAVAVSIFIFLGLRQLLADPKNWNATSPKPRPALSLWVELLRAKVPAAGQLQAP